MGRAARCLLFIYLFFSCVCRYTKDELFCCFFIIIYLNYSARGCGRIPFPWDFPLGRDKYNIHLVLFFCFVFSLRQQMSSFSNYNGPRQPFFFPLYGPKNIPLLKRIYFEIVEWQKISRKITCSAAANVIKQTRSSFFFFSRPRPPARPTRSLGCWLTCHLEGEHKSDLISVLLSDIMMEKSREVCLSVCAVLGLLILHIHITQEMNIIQ